MIEMTLRLRQCASCEQLARCVIIPIKPWWPYIPDQLGDREVHLCEQCLTQAMLTARPFSVIPAQSSNYMYDHPESDVEG